MAKNSNSYEGVSDAEINEVLQGDSGYLSEGQAIKSNALKSKTKKKQAKAFEVEIDFDDEEVP